MKKYMFTDCITPPPEANVVSDSVSGSISCDICGKQYEDLIKLCCKYSSVFSIIVQVPAMNVVKELEKFRIERPENIEFNHNHYVTKENTEPGGRFYKVCPELCEFLINKADSIYEWINGWDFENPEDPTFYRKDGSVFFTSVIVLFSLQFISLALVESLHLIFCFINIEHNKNYANNNEDANK